MKFLEALALEGFEIPHTSRHRLSTNRRARATTCIPQHERLRNPVIVPYMMHYTFLPECVVWYVFRRYLCRQTGFMQTVCSAAASCICVSKVHGNMHIWNL